MSERFELERVTGRQQFPGGPNEDPGIRLAAGYLPGKTFAGGLEYLHIQEITPDGQLVPSPLDAVDPQTGRVIQPGEIVIVDTCTEPPKVVKHAGSYALQDGVGIAYIPKRLF